MLDIARSRFNTKPGAGISYLTEVCCRSAAWQLWGAGGKPRQQAAAQRAVRLARGILWRGSPAATPTTFTTCQPLLQQPTFACPFNSPPAPPPSSLPSPPFPSSLPPSPFHPLTQFGYFTGGDDYAKEIAEYLFRFGKDGGLSKTQMGEYLGEHKPLNLSVLDEFVQLHDFRQLSFDKALRTYLWCVCVWGGNAATGKDMAGADVTCLDLSVRLLLPKKVLSASRRGPKDRPHDGGVCQAFLHLQSGRVSVGWGSGQGRDTPKTP